MEINMIIHSFRWYFISVFVGIFVYIQHDGTNYSAPHRELVDNLNIITPAIAETKKDVFEKETKPILYNRKDIACLANNVYFEAANEPMLGKVAVAQITINRVKNGYWGDTICDVVHAKDQFSWTNRDKHKIERDSEQYKDSVSAAEKILSDRQRLRALRHALFYHADYVQPNWADHSQRVGKIGAHVFYNGAKGSSLSL
jgi:spore germination cell wall hydrolase CwlJ-like protein